jgi:hypothetical protein
MKKLLLSLFVIFGLTSLSANADMTNVGIKITSANMEASGSETVDSGSTNSGGAAKSQPSKDSNFQIGSLFVERQLEGKLGGNDLVLGLELVPFTAEIDKLGGSDGFDATLEIGMLATAYVQPMFKANDDVTIFVKAGYSQADLDINSISRQAGSASQTGDTQSTDGAQSKTLEGPMYGAGIQVSMNSVLDFVRLEGTVTDFDEITHTNSNGKVLKADAELTTISLSLVKSF